MRTLMFRHSVAALTIGFIAMLDALAAAQVVIDMPAPPRPRMQPTILAPQGEQSESTIKTSSSTTTIAASAIPGYPVSTRMPEVGEVALFRYSSARRGTRDTFFNDGSFWNNGMRWNGGIRFISFPRFVWGPWGGWGGWGWWGWSGGSWPGRCW